MNQIIAGFLEPPVPFMIFLIFFAIGIGIAAEPRKKSRKHSK